MTNQKQTAGHLMALICVLVWGSTFIVSKGLMEFLQPVQLMLLRFTLAYGALWIIHPRWYLVWKEEQAKIRKARADIAIPLSYSMHLYYIRNSKKSNASYSE